MNSFFLNCNFICLTRRSHYHCHQRNCRFFDIIDLVVREDCFAPTSSLFIDVPLQTKRGRPQANLSNHRQFFTEQTLQRFVSRCRSAKRFANLNLKTRQNTVKNGALYDDIMNLLIEFVFLVLQGFYRQCKTSKCTMDEG